MRVVDDGISFVLPLSTSSFGVIPTVGNCCAREGYLLIFSKLSRCFCTPPPKIEPPAVLNCYLNPPHRPESWLFCGEVFLRFPVSSPEYCFMIFFFFCVLFFHAVTLPYLALPRLSRAQSQLEHAHRVKDERSAEALTAKRNAADLEQKVKRCGVSFIFLGVFCAKHRC